MKEYMKQLFTAPRSRRAMFFLLFAAVMLLNSSPELRADALYLIADGETVSVYMSQRKYPAFKKAFFNFAGGIL